MKQIPKHNVNDMVYAISFSNDSIDNKVQADKVEEWDRDYARIYSVRIVSISIDMKGIHYLVEDPKITTDAEWGDTIKEEYVSKTKEPLFKYLVQRWKL